MPTKQKSRTASTRPVRVRVGKSIAQSSSLLDIESLSAEDITEILEQTRKMENMRRDRKARQKLGKHYSGRRVALLFYEPSTRTRVSFEFAAKTLGATTTIVNATSSSIEKGESLLDTGCTLRALGADSIVIRHPSSGAPHILARDVGVTVLNAGDGLHEHPTQALLDAFTMLKHYKTLRGLRVLLVGDIFHSRVARSNIHLLYKMGAHVTLCGPDQLLPELALTLVPGMKIERDFDTAIRNADVVMMLRVQKERLAGLNLDVEDYIRNFQLDGVRKAMAKKSTLFMHPGPMVRGMEITAEVADGERSAVLEQVSNGVSVRMAVLARALPRN